MGRAGGVVQGASSSQGAQGPAGVGEIGMTCKARLINHSKSPATKSPVRGREAVLFAALTGLQPCDQARPSYCILGLISADQGQQGEGRCIGRIFSRLVRGIT